MKSTGIVRKVDQLGRIVVPKEIRTTLDVAPQDPLEIFLDGENIILRKFKAEGRCDVTGQKATFSFADGTIQLSDEGCVILLQEMKSRI